MIECILIQYRRTQKWNLFVKKYSVVPTIMSHLLLRNALDVYSTYYNRKAEDFPPRSAKQTLHVENSISINCFIRHKNLPACRRNTDVFITLKSWNILEPNFYQQIFWIPEVGPRLLGNLAFFVVKSCWGSRCSEYEYENIYLTGIKFTDILQRE